MMLQEIEQFLILISGRRIMTESVAIKTPMTIQTQRCMLTEFFNRFPQE